MRQQPPVKSSEKPTPNTSASTTTTGAATASAPIASNSAPSASAPPGNNSASQPPPSSNGYASASAKVGSARAAATRNPARAHPNASTSKRSKDGDPSAAGAAHRQSPIPRRPRTTRLALLPADTTPQGPPGLAAACPPSAVTQPWGRQRPSADARPAGTCEIWLAESAPATTLELALEQSSTNEWEGQDSNLCRQSQRVYSPSPLTTRTPSPSARILAIRRFEAPAPRAGPRASSACCSRSGGCARG